MLNLSPPCLGYNGHSIMYDADGLQVQAARILEHIELFEELYPEDIEESGSDLKNGLRVSAVAIRAFLEDSGYPLSHKRAAHPKIIS